MAYRNIDCPNCGRGRVESDGVCEKCEWDIDGGDYARVTRAEDYDAQGHRLGKEVIERIERADEERWGNLGKPRPELRKDVKGQSE